MILEENDIHTVKQKISLFYYQLLVLSSSNGSSPTTNSVVFNGNTIGKIVLHLSHQKGNANAFSFILKARYYRHYRHGEWWGAEQSNKKRKTASTNEGKLLPVQLEASTQVYTIFNIIHVYMFMCTRRKITIQMFWICSIFFTVFLRRAKKQEKRKKVNGRKMEKKKWKNWKKRVDGKNEVVSKKKRWYLLFVVIVLFVYSGSKVKLL